jgi:hypothetical protein
MGAQHHSLHLSCGSRKPANPEKEFFLTKQYVNVIENKGPLWKTVNLSWNVYENKGDTSRMRECC